MKELSKEKNPNFFKCWDLETSRKWFDYEVYAETTKDITMQVWNHKHPAEQNMESHVCKESTKVRVWMVSRFGDVGITDVLENPRGYHARVDADLHLTNFEFIKKC